MQRIFYFTPEGSYTGDGVADIDPRTGKPLVPANATLIPPGSAKSKWSGKSWVKPKTKKTKLAKVPPTKNTDLAFTDDAPLADERPTIDMTTKTDAPKTDAPKTDAPKTDAPKTDAPKTDAPKTDAPKTDAPKVKTISLGKKKANRP